MIFSLLRRLDYPLLLILLALFGVGLTTLYAAVYHGDFAIWYKQLVFWSVGLLAFFCLLYSPACFGLACMAHLSGVGTLSGSGARHR